MVGFFVAPPRSISTPSRARTAVAAGTGSAIGDWTGGGGLAAGYNGNTSQTAGAGPLKAAATVAYIGKDWGAGNEKYPGGFKIWASSDAGFVNAADPNITATLQVSTDNFAASTVDFCSAGPTADSNGLLLENTSVADGGVAYRYHRIKVEQSGGAASMYCSEAEHYEFA